GSNTFTRFHALIKSCAVRRGVFPRHRADTQVIQSLRRHGQADQPASKLRHEIDSFRRDLLSGHSKVAFVLSVFVIDDHNHASGADFFNRRGNVGKCAVGWHGGMSSAINSSKSVAKFSLHLGPETVPGLTSWKRHPASVTAAHTYLAPYQWW